MHLGERVPRRGSRCLQWLGRSILRLFGWHLEVTVPNQPKLVVIAAPHTSNWDFVFGLAAVLALDLDLHWFGKHTLFRRPFYRLFTALGGIPVDRAAAGGVVRQTTQRFAASPQLVIGLAPEGTRARVEQWKRGFYNIALAARVPIVPAYIDYRRKVIGTTAAFVPSGDFDADMAPVFAMYRGVAARWPDKFAAG